MTRKWCPFSQVVFLEDEEENRLVYTNREIFIAKREDTSCLTTLCMAWSEHSKCCKLIDGR